MESQNISELFQKAFIADREKFIEDWLVSWEYQDIRKRRKISYNEELPEDFYKFNGLDDLVKWINWFMPEYPDYIDNAQIHNLIDTSKRTDQELFAKLGLPFAVKNYEKNVGINNAHDFFFPQMYPVPERNRIKRVLDFGAGYGRQANLWAANSPEKIYIGMDGIPLSYCLQYLYYKNLGVNSVDYIDAIKDFSLDFETPGIYHIPTWRFDLIPNNSIDLVIGVQVFQELSAKLLKHVLSEFNRVLKPGGMFYIRDHAYTWKPAHNVDVEKHLRDDNFDLEFKAYIINDKDLHGIPRIWRKADPEVLEAQKMSFNSKLKHTFESLDGVTGGKLFELKSKLKKSK